MENICRKTDDGELKQSKVTEILSATQLSIFQFGTICESVLGTEYQKLVLLIRGHLWKHKKIVDSHTGA